MPEAWRADKLENNYIVPKIQLFFSSKNMILKYLSAEKFKNQDWPFYYVFVNLNFWTKNGLLEHCVAKRGEKNCSAWLKYFCILIVLTWFLMYHLAFLPLCDNLAEKVTSSRDPCLIFLSTGSSIHSNFSCKLSNTVRKS